jgi:hypothetical protein
LLDSLILADYKDRSACVDPTLQDILEKSVRKLGKPLGG